MSQKDESVMKRRLMLFEKIKTSKLNKLTIKQGDLNVKLNLKKDLLDPNVDIPEKVLCMLEAYEVKPFKTIEEQAQAFALPTPPHFTESSLQLHSEVHPTHKTISFSPNTKRVRFELSETLEPNSYLPTKPLDLTESTIMNKSKNSSIIITKLSNKEQLQAEKSSQLVDTNEAKSVADQQIFSCRLCRLKCSNEKALYEHVSRFCFIFISLNYFTSSQD